MEFFYLSAPASFIGQQLVVDGLLLWMVAPLMKRTVHRLIQWTFYPKASLKRLGHGIFIMD